MRDTGIESVSAGQPEEERESLQAGGRTLPFDHPRCSAATCSVSVALAASASRGRSVAICTVVLARYPHRVGTDSPRDGSGCAAVTAVAIFGNWSAAARVFAGGHRGLHSPRPLTSVRGQTAAFSRHFTSAWASRDCAPICFRNTGTWPADPHAGSQSLICARCLVGKSATRRGLGMGVRCCYMASSDALQRVIQEYLQVP